MPITEAQRTAAERQQNAAAEDPSDNVSLVAGPGTGKSKTIEARIAYILGKGVKPENVYVISFTVAASDDLERRIRGSLAGTALATAAAGVKVSTMHSLALRILRSANLLASLYPSDPTILDDWERKNIYDPELSSFLGCTPGRAAEIRLAHDAYWQTLNPTLVDQAAITEQEKARFESFHSSRVNLYCFVLTGELLYRFVDAIEQGSLQPDQLPLVEELVIDEFQDLNACDQRFVKIFSRSGAKLFVAGDDDQSIYSFRHADPSGLVTFAESYPGSSLHVLSDCFRCTPEILKPSSKMIAFNPDRLPKTLNSLYEASEPPVSGVLQVWSFASAESEARGVAHSCQRLIDAGMKGQENEILILISDRGLQLPLITQELSNLGLPFDQPPGEALADTFSLRAVYTILRIARDQWSGKPDYIAHRTLLCLLSKVGTGTAKKIGDACIAKNQNFYDLFYLAKPPDWLDARGSAAVDRAIGIVRALGNFSQIDLVGDRRSEISDLMRNRIFAGAGDASSLVEEWEAFAAAFPDAMTLDEMLQFFAAGDEAERRELLESVAQRLGSNTSAPQEEPEKRIRILTMHGAKGLSGKVVFIPSVEQGIMPSFRALKATGLVIEQRRLFYVSATRARAVCIISHAALHTGPVAFRLKQAPTARLTRSQFLNEMNVKSQNRSDGLRADEADEIITCANSL